MSESFEPYRNLEALTSKPGCPIVPLPVCLVNLTLPILVNQPLEDLEQLQTMDDSSPFSSRYAYSEETGDDLEEEGISLTGSAVKVAGDLATKLERKERKVSIATDHVFGLGEDLEEDKRE
ncbi:hypothetical protein F0562_026391 [Nyssa sinensis]|uniref:Uncharacterized protein n=1 Tax=Nyssa sinensis TaxID=561372 RepID=A0A5J5BAK4_9ASTE|nr:hypothetical protein F0562_026391 [Nyssa sinensis]